MVSRDRELSAVSASLPVSSLNCSVPTAGGTPPLPSAAIHNDNGDSITRRQIERAVRDSAAHFAELISRVADPVLVLDADMRIRYASPAIADVLGHAPGHLVGAAALDLVHPDDRADCERRLADLLDGSHIETRTHRARHADGTWRLLESRGRRADFGGRTMIVVNSRDVTEQHRTEQALRRSEGMFRSLIEQLPGAVYLIRLDDAGTPVYVSPQMAEITGREPRAFTDNPALWESLLHPDDRDHAAATFENASRDRGSFEMSYRLRHVDGSWRWVRDNGKTVCDDAGRPICVQGFMTDTTELCEARRREEETAARFRAVFENAGVGIGVARDDGRIVESNRALQRMLGYSAVEFRRMTYLDITHPDDRDDAGRRYREVVDPNDTNTFMLEKRYLHKDGSVRWALVIGSRIPLGADGRPGVLAAIHDITPLRQVRAREKEIQDRFRAIFEHSAVGMSLTDESGRLIQTNPCLQRMLGHTGGELRRLTFVELSHPDDALGNLHSFRRMMAGQIDNLETTKRYIRSDGKIIWVHLQATAVRRSGKPPYCLAVIRDVTAERDAREQLVRLRQAVDQAPDWITIIDGQHRFEYVNSCVERITGYTRDELVGQTALILRPGDCDNAELDDLRETLRRGQSHRALMAHKTKSGDPVYLDQTVTPVRDRKGRVTHYVSTAKDITQEKQLEDRLLRMANYDPLTGVPNRALFVDRVEQVLARAAHTGRRAAVLILNLDRFKTINETFGTAAGDEVLRQVGVRLQASLREGDSIARMGSDEFAVSLVDLAEGAHAIHVVRKITKRIAAPFQVNGQSIVATASVGVAVFPGDGVTAAELMKNADISLSHAKRHGRRNAVEFYTAGMNRTANERVEMESRLFGAAARNEFELNYQPFYDVATGRCVGMEALLRWRHRELGMVPPARFIPILEDAGLIGNVGEHILQMAARQIRRWTDDGLDPVPISVNLSPIQFRDIELADRVASILGKHRVDPALLSLEITENTFMSDDDQTHRTLSRLRDLGLSISIDDFGTGYSSLRYLQRYPVDHVKIDISFVKDISSNADDASIVTAIISMAHQLQLRTIAEGVETDDQLRILRLLRCDMAQGFYLARPVPPEKAARFLQPRAATPRPPSHN